MNLNALVVLASLVVVAFGQVKNGEPLNESWLMAYLFFCGPSLLLWLSALIEKSKILSAISVGVGSGTIILWAYSLITNGGLGLSSIALLWAIGSVIVFIVVILKWCLFFAKEKFGGT